MAAVKEEAACSLGSAAAWSGLLRCTTAVRRLDMRPLADRMLSRPTPALDAPRRTPGRDVRLTFRTSYIGEVEEDRDVVGSSNEWGDEPGEGNKLLMDVEGDVGIEIGAAVISSGSFPARARLFSSSPLTVRML